MIICDIRTNAGEKIFMHVCNGSACTFDRMEDKDGYLFTVIRANAQIEFYVGVSFYTMVGV